MGKTFDTAVIGGGPAGLTAAVYGARSGLKTVLFDAGESGGALASASKVANFPGMPQAVPGSKIISILREQAVNFGAEIIDSRVDEITAAPPQKKISAGGEIIEAKTVIIASGSMGRQAGIKGEKEFTGKGVGYCAACDAAFFKGKNVAMIGSPESILNEIDMVARFAKKIYAVIPSGAGKSEDELSEKSKLLQKHKPEEIFGEKFVEGLRVRDKEGRDAKLAVSGVFIYLKGNKPAVDFLKEGIKKSEDGCIETDPRTMAASIEGVFAAGDVTCKSFRQAVVSASEGCRAALSAEGYISGRKKPKHIWH